MKIKGGREDLVAYVCKKTSQIIAGTDHSLTHKQSLQADLNTIIFTSKLKIGQRIKSVKYYDHVDYVVKINITLQIR